MIGPITIFQVGNFMPFRDFTCAAVIGGAVLLATSVGAQERYQTSAEAVNALISAAKDGDVSRLIRLLGPASADIMSSGDLVADASARRSVIDAYDAKHRLDMEGADKAVLILGNDDWPFPIPLARKDGTWRFDAGAARNEILYRRIGRNELSAIQTCLAYVDAQQEYAQKGVAGKGVYATRIVSQPGKKDGLYWPSQAGEEESPLGEFAAAAAVEGYRPGERPVPYHGYFYKILIREGSSVRRSSLDYVVRGRMIGGFALVAYPAEYRKSGVMTFIVNHRGTVYEKDLGSRTSLIASRMIGFDPDITWRIAGKEEKAPGSAQVPAAGAR